MMRALGATFLSVVFAAAGAALLAPAPASAQSATPSPDPMTAAECVGCHAIPDIVVADDGKYRPGLYVRPEDLASSMHAGFACTDCHSSLSATMHARRDAARDSCRMCHEEQYADYEAGYHGTAGQGLRPTCITCHGAHTVQDANTRSFVHRASEQCDRCHTQMNEAFMGGNPFGMDTHLAGVDVATCADCHGYHTVLPSEDPASPVNQANILTTCRQCHADAPANFVDVQMHVAEGPIPDDPRLRVVTIYMLTLLIGTFGFFGYLTVLGIRFEWRRQAERARERSGTGGVL
ncbi:MAG TPA: multiheme c-type cytochrome [Actinomycetota bacterium]|nr:multiheme c-type cytochrome [Actinomycetota bacterium]